LKRAENDRFQVKLLVDCDKAGKYVGSGMGACARGAFAAADRGVQWLQIGDDYGNMVAQVETLFREIRSRQSLSRDGS